MKTKLLLSWSSGKDAAWALHLLREDPGFEVAGLPLWRIPLPWPCPNETHTGRAFDLALLEELPPAVDPCGEEGEFHTFVWDGPMFRHPLPVRLGDTTLRDGFARADLRLEAETE
jgi:diphthamide synthase (EF-2-diphthine--ammonia ligase)